MPAKPAGIASSLRPGPGRIGAGVDDPNEIRPIWLSQLAGNLDRDLLAGARREPVYIPDQRNPSPNPGLLHLRIQSTAVISLANDLSCPRWDCTSLFPTRRDILTPCERIRLR